MKLLLDECLPLDFRHCFPNHQTHTAEWAGFKGTKNGHLLRAAEAAGYNVLLTVDHGIPHQQRPGGRNISIILIRAQTNQLEDLTPLADAVEQALANIRPGETVTVPA
jgi:predicted nuclease of predicted toxin-antitoxin system